MHFVVSVGHHKAKEVQTLLQWSVLKLVPKDQTYTDQLINEHLVLQELQPSPHLKRSAGTPSHPNSGRSFIHGLTVQPSPVRWAGRESPNYIPSSHASEQPGLVESTPAHGSGVGIRWFLRFHPIKAILWFYVWVLLGFFLCFLQISINLSRCHFFLPGYFWFLILIKLCYSVKSRH